MRVVMRASVRTVSSFLSTSRIARGATARRSPKGPPLLHSTLGQGHTGAYRIQAAIAALHDEAPSTDATDWPQIQALYDVLPSFTDNPMAHLSRAIALAMVRGPAEALAALDALTRHSAIVHYERTAQRTTSTAERDYLLLRAARSGG